MEDISELWFFQAKSGGQPGGWIALEKQNHVDPKNRTLLKHNLQIPHGTVFFVPFDNRNTAELARKASAAAANDDVKFIYWPETWPVNKR